MHTLRNDSHGDSVICCFPAALAGWYSCHPLLPGGQPGSSPVEPYHSMRLSSVAQTTHTPSSPSWEAPLLLPSQQLSAHSEHWGMMSLAPSTLLVFPAASLPPPPRHRLTLGLRKLSTPDASWGLPLLTGGSEYQAPWGLTATKTGAAAETGAREANPGQLLINYYYYLYNIITDQGVWT